MISLHPGGVQRHHGLTRGKERHGVQERRLPLAKGAQSSTGKGPITSGSRLMDLFNDGRQTDAMRDDAQALVCGTANHSY